MTITWPKFRITTLVTEHIVNCKLLEIQAEASGEWISIFMNIQKRDCWPKIDSNKGRKKHRKNEMKKHVDKLRKTNLKKGGKRRKGMKNKLKIVVVKLVCFRPRPSKKIDSLLPRIHFLSNLLPSWNFDWSLNDLWSVQLQKSITLS